MPARLVRCRDCRTLLNNDLEPAQIEIPQFQPMQVLDSFVELPPRGFYVACPECGRELKISRNDHGKGVRCASCGDAFEFRLCDERLAKLGFYVNCPCCHRQLRMSPEDAGERVGCMYCQESIRIVGEEAALLDPV
jgi:hypothetical protein